MKKLIALILSLSLVFSLTAPANAATSKRTLAVDVTCSFGKTEKEITVEPGSEKEFELYFSTTGKEGVNSIRIVKPPQKSQLSVTKTAVDWKQGRATFKIAAKNGATPAYTNFILWNDNLGAMECHDLKINVAGKKDTEDIQSLSFDCGDKGTMPRGATGRVKIPFSGCGISSLKLINPPVITGIKAEYQNVDWVPYPNQCAATLQIKTDSTAKPAFVLLLMMNSAMGAIKTKCISLQISEDKSTKVELVNEMKQNLLNNASEHKKTLENCFAVSQKVFGSKQFIKSLGLTAGAVSSGFTTAGWSVATDPDLICGISQLEVARYATNKALAAADAVLSYKNKPLDNTSAIQFLEAYRDCAAWSHAASSILNPILQEYAQQADKSTAQQVLFLSNFFLEGTLDGMLCGLRNIDAVADTLLKIRDASSGIASFVSAALPMFPAYDSYQSTYQQWQQTIDRLSQFP